MRETASLSEFMEVEGISMASWIKCPGIFFPYSLFDSLLFVPVNRVFFWKVLWAFRMTIRM
jgi:hypothetical protein